MINQFDYMNNIRPIIEPVFHDDMTTANAILLAIQKYQNDENFVPKVDHNYSVSTLDNSVAFVIDSANMVINNRYVKYKVILFASKSEFTYVTKPFDRIEYKITIYVDADAPGKEKMSVKCYALLTTDSEDVIKFIENGIFEKDMERMLGDISWRIQKECMAEAKECIHAIEHAAYNMFDTDMLTESPRPIFFGCDLAKEAKNDG